MTAGAIRCAAVDDAERVGWFVSRAVLDDPVAGWVVPVPLHRREILPRYVAAAAQAAVGAGAVHVVGSFEGVAVWVGTAAPAAPGPGGPAAAGPYADRFEAWEAVVRAARPVDRPHHRLAFLAVRDALRGQGIGSALLEAQHAHLDRQGLGAYASPTTAEARRTLQRYGYHDVAPPVRPTDDAPPTWPMWRPPGGLA